MGMASINDRLYYSFFQFFFPYRELSRKADYYLNQPQREKVVSLIERGELFANASGVQILPWNYMYLSNRNGEVLLERSPKTSGIKVFFVIYSGFDNSTGYLYTTDGFYTENAYVYKPIRKIEENWYWSDHN